MAPLTHSYFLSAMEDNGAKQPFGCNGLYARRYFRWRFKDPR